MRSRKGWRVLSAGSLAAVRCGIQVVTKIIITAVYLIYFNVTMWFLQDAVYHSGEFAYSLHAGYGM